MMALSLIQGTSEWHQHRRAHLNASDAPAMLSCSPYKTRTQLLHELKTGLTPEIDAATQRRFDSGHAIEAKKRPVAESIMGEALYPTVGAEGQLSASFDGLSMLEDQGWECKSLNADLCAALPHPGPEGNDAANLPKHYRVQMEQQCAVAGCAQMLFTASDGANDDRHCWYFPDLALRAEIIAGWEQFTVDLAAYVPATAAPVVVTPLIESLPTLVIRVEGRVVSSNLDAYREAAVARIESVKTDLATDQDFAEADATAKSFKDGAAQLKMAKQQAQAEAQSIDEVFRAVDFIVALLDKKRIELEGLVKTEKDRRRGEIVAVGVKALAQHIDALNARLGRIYMPIGAMAADFGGAIKGKKSLASMEDAVSSELARAKIAASAIADRIQENMRTLDAHAEHAALFPDRGQILVKAKDDFDALVASRIAQHKASIEAAAEKARERIRQEEMQRIEREREEADAKARRVAEQKERDEFTIASRAQQAIDVVARPVAKPAETAKTVDTPPTLTLGQIGTRLGFSLTADFIRTLGFEPVKVKAACLFHEEQFDPICEALIAHVQSIQALQAA